MREGIMQVAFFVFRFIPESTRWLRSQHKITEAECILQKVAKTNKKLYPINSKLQPPEVAKNSGSYKDLFVPSSRMWKTLSFGTMWLVKMQHNILVEAWIMIMWFLLTTLCG